MIKEIKYGGYTGSPSDYECLDGDLAMSVNMVPEKSALHMVMPPEQLFILPQYHSVMCLHDMTGNTNYIINDTDAEKLWYLKDSDIPAASSRPLNAAGVSSALSANGVVWEYGNTRTVNSICPVGNTLVVLASDGVHYILWKNSSYTYLGQKFPELNITFGLKSALECWPKDNGNSHADAAVCRGMTSRKNVPGMPFIDNEHAWVKPKPIMEPLATTTYAEFHEDYTYSIEHLSGENGEAGVSSLSNRWTNFALGQLNKFVMEHATSKGKFVHPFFVRWAYELYDGSLVMHSDPILMVPNSRPPFFAMDGEYDWGFELEDADNQNVNFRFRGRTYGFVSELKAKITAANLNAFTSTWKDIITRLNIYVSAPLYTYKQDGKVWGWTNMDDSGSWDSYFTEGDYTFGQIGTHYGHHSISSVFQTWNEASGLSASARYYRVYVANSDLGETGTFPLPSYILTIPEPNTEERTDNVCKAGNFYKIASYAFDESEVTGMLNTEKTIEIEDGVLQSLVARETMQDDYHSRDILTAGHAFAYNGRVNLSGITRTIHAPMAAVNAWAKDDTNSSRGWQIAVELDNGNSRSIVVNSSSEQGTDMPRYLFYPDSRAKTMWVRYSTSGTWTKIYKVNLTTHEMLEGAYWFGGLESSVTGMTEVSTWPTAANGSVEEPNKIYTSEANTPFRFPLLGINSVGTGKILGICSAVKALSQGQFGQFPLYAFTTEGVWALQVTGTGGYSAVQPVTRDVCISAESITQMDDSVLFATDRGIMIISGSTSVCMSEAIDTEKPFAVSSLPGLSTYLSGSNSTDSAVPSASVGSVVTGIVTTAPSLAAFRTFLAGCRMLYDYTLQRVYVYNPSYTYSYVYSLDTKKWGMAQNSMKYGINAYPEAQAVIDGTGGGIVVNMSTTAWTKSVQGLLITRPLKLDAPDALKTIDTIIQRGYFDTHNSETVSGTAVHVRNVRQILYGSRDMFNWYRVFSSADEYLRGFSGSPYKYFRIVAIVNLKETESIVSGTIKYTPRLMNQPR